ARWTAAEALGGFMINPPFRDIRNVLLVALTEAGASGGSHWAGFLQDSSACRTGSDLTAMLPLASTRFAPNDWKIAPAVSTLSSVTPKPMPNGKPALWQASAALSMASSVQASAFGGEPAGYIACTSIPACFFR